MQERKVNLVTGGSIYDKDSPFSKGFILVREPSNNEEELLVNPDYVSDGTAVDKFIESLLIDKTIDVNQLNAIDKVGLIIQLRIITYGFDFNVPYTCPYCGVKQQVHIDVNEDLSVTSAQVKIENQTEFFYNVLNTDGEDVTIKFHLLSSKEEMEMIKQLEKTILNKNVKNKMILSGKVVKCIDEFTIGKTVFNNIQAINEFVTSKMKPLDRAKFVKYYESMLPKLDTSKEITCVNCKKSTTEDIPLLADIFLSPKYI